MLARQVTLIATGITWSFVEVTDAGNINVTQTFLFEEPVQDIEGMLAAQALAAQSHTSHPAVNGGAADLGYALGCALGGGCDGRSVDNGSLFETPERPQQSYSYAPIRPHVSLSPITSPNYFGPQSPVPITDPNYHSPENRALRDLLNQQ
jgi:hypothetical protein